MEWKTYLAYAAPVDVTGTKWEDPPSISDDIKIDIFKKYSNLEILTTNGDFDGSRLWVAFSHAVRRTDSFSGALDIDIDRLGTDANDMLAKAELDRLDRETGIVTGQPRWVLLGFAEETD